MNYETTQTLSDPQFKRRFGVQRPTFKRMVTGLQAPLSRYPGRPAQLSVENQILVALEYWREYRTYFGVVQRRVTLLVNRSSFKALPKMS